MGLFCFLLRSKFAGTKNSYSVPTALYGCNDFVATCISSLKGMMFVAIKYRYHKASTRRCRYNKLSKPDELESLEKLLCEKVQQQPDAEVYADLLIWVTMQQRSLP